MAQASIPVAMIMFLDRRRDRGIRGIWIELCPHSGREEISSRKQRRHVLFAFVAFESWYGLMVYLVAVRGLDDKRVITSHGIENEA